MATEPAHEDSELRINITRCGPIVASLDDKQMAWPMAITYSDESCDHKLKPYKLINLTILE